MLIICILNSLTNLNLHFTKILNLFWLFLDASEGCPIRNLITPLPFFISKTATYLLKIPQY